MSLFRNKNVRLAGGLALAGASLLPAVALTRELAPDAAPDDSYDSYPTSAAPAMEQALEDLSHQFRAIARRVEPSVVHIEVLGARRAAPGSSQGMQQMDPEELLERFFGDRGGMQLQPQPQQQNPYHQFDLPQQTGTGSGWVYDVEGHIVTNHHVVDGARELRVRFHDGAEKEARLVASDASTDVAVIQVEESRSLVPAKVSREAPQQGDIVFAFGSPMSFEFSMSQGIVAATGRRTGILGPGGYEDFIQTDAAINPGNSGGPLTDVHGHVVGMNASIASRSGLFSGIGFAIPVETMQPVIEQLISDGRVDRGYLGVLIQDQAELLRSFGYEGEGVLISDVMPDGPAAGVLESGDIVTRVEGRRVEDAEALRLAVAALKPGAAAHLDIVRDGEERQVVVELGQAPQDLAGAGGQRSEREPSARGQETLMELGLESVRTLDGAQAEELGLERDQRGVLLESVRSRSAAAAAGLRPGVVLTHVGETRVASRSELAEALTEADLERGVRVALLDQGRQRYAFLRLPR